MPRLKALVAAAVACVIGAGPLFAQTIDQSQQTEAALYVGRTGSDAGCAQCLSNGWTSQSFTPTMNTSAGAAFYLSPFTDNSGMLTIELWTKSPGAAGSVKLAGGTTALGAIPAYYTVFYGSVAVTAGQQYFLTFYSAARYNIHANYNVYAGGDLRYNNSTTDTDVYGGNGCCDTRFIEYATGPVVEPPPTTPTVVPEPATVVLMAAGLVTLAGVASRRRRAAHERAS